MDYAQALYTNAYRGCYIPHKESSFYARYGVDPQALFEDLSMDICTYIQQGHVMVLGDLNARVGRTQIQPIAQDELNKEEALDVDTCWRRHSEDADTNAHGCFSRYRYQMVWIAFPTLKDTPAILIVGDLV